MPNILDYLTWRGDVPFSVSPPNEVDNYIHCKIGTLDFTGIVPENELYVPLPQAVEAYFAAGGAEKLGALSSPYIAPMVKRLPETVRFREVMLTGFRQVYDEKKTEQFSALTLRLPGGQHYVTFRGTDDTIVGWKEDCLLTVMDEIPAQRDAVEYLTWAASVYPGKIAVGGHSKGGNLAVYSAMKCAPFVQKRIQKIYSLDGPGFRPEMLKECHYNAIEGKVVKLLPHSSMIGMIFERDIHYRVVESNSHGLLQHDPFSWLVEEDHFVDVGDIYESQKIMNEALNEWILSLNEEQVRTFVETLYQVISASQADDLITFTADWKKSMNAVVTALKEVDDQTAEMLRGIIRSLFEIAKVKVREELAPAKKPGRRFRNKKKEEKAEAHRPVPEDAPDATAAQGSAARHAPKLRGSRHRGSAE